MLSVSIATYPLLPTAFWIYTLVPFVALPVGLSMANIAALISKSVSAEKQGAALGINGSLNAFAQGIVPLMAGFLAGAFGLSFPFFVGGILVLIAWGTFVFSLRLFVSFDDTRFEETER
jgi:MFS family permease